MRILLMNGSPKTGESASGTLLQLLQEHLQQAECVEVALNRKEVPDGLLDELKGMDVLVLSFPLYIDSIPSHLLRCMIQIQEYLKEHNLQRPVRFYGIANNGFFDGKQNQLALQTLRHWCNRCGLDYSGGIGLGGGGMVISVKIIPGEHGPKKNMVMALKQLAHAIAMEDQMEELLLEMSYPEDLYKTQAESSWRKMAMDNGLKLNELGKQW